MTTTRVRWTQQRSHYRDYGMKGVEMNHDRTTTHSLPALSQYRHALTIHSRIGDWAVLSMSRDKTRCTTTN